jgi:hypothetical protein
LLGVLPGLVLVKGPGYKPLSLQETLISCYVFFSYFALCLLGMQKKITSIFTIAIMSFFAYCVLMAVGSYVEDASIQQVFASLILHFRYIFLSLVVGMSCTNAGRPYLVAGIIGIGWIVAIYAVIQVAVIAGSSGGAINLDVVKRTLSVFPNPNMFGVVLLIGAILYFPYLDRLPTRFVYINLFIVIVPICIGILVSYSRRSWLLLVIAAIMYSFLKRGRGRVSLKMIILFVLFFFGTFDLAPVFDRVQQIFDPQYASNSIREDDYTRLFNIATASTANFLGGVGAGTIGPPRLEPGHIDYQIDSYFLQILLEYGFVGLSLYLFTIIYSIMRFYRIRSMPDISNEVHNEYLSYSLTIFCLLIVSFVGSTSITFPISIFQWILVGLLVRRFQYHA